MIGWAIQVGDLPSVDGWWRVTFQRPARLTIDAGREAQQEREDQSRGLMTRQDHLGGRGKDWQRETDQCFAGDAYVIDRGKARSEATGVSAEMVLQRYGFTGLKREDSQSAQSQGVACR